MLPHNVQLFRVGYANASDCAYYCTPNLVWATGEEQNCGLVLCWAARSLYCKVVQVVAYWSIVGACTHGLLAVPISILVFSGTLLMYIEGYVG